jgi:hypothetical protein
MKNRSRSSAHDVTSAKPIELNITLRIRPERCEEFTRLGRWLSLTNDQLASVMINTNMEADEGNPFEEIGYHLMFSAIDLYPEHEAALGPLRDAFVGAVNASDVLWKLRWLKEGVL